MPGLFVEGTGARRQITINGMSNLWGNGALVGMYLDEADATSQGDAAANGYGQFNLQTYDLERVEVLRGPQGTLYGEGSVGGTIHFITNKPVLDRFQMNADEQALFTQYGAPSQRIEAMVNTPLVTDTLALRFAGVFEHDGGWVDQPAADLKNINNQNLVDARVEALWQPTSQFKINAFDVIHRSDGGINCCENPKGQFTQAFDLTLAPTVSDNSNLSNITMTYDFSGVRLLSSTTYFDHNLHAQNHGYQIPFGGVTYDYLISDYPLHDENVSEEFRIARTGDGPWQWTAGAFYKHYTDDSTLAGYFGAPGPLLPDEFSQSLYSFRSNSWSGFGDTSYKLFGHLTVGAGVRYFKDSQTAGPTPIQEADFTSTDPRFYLQYQVSPNVNTYVSAAKGFRSGGFNASPSPGFGPEQVWTYDLGTKMRLLDGHLTVDADIYQSNWSDYVIFGFRPFPISASVSSNAGNAKVKGANADLEWVPTEGWNLGLRGSYVDGKFTTINAQNSGFQVGDQLPEVSKYSVTASLEREFRLADKPSYARLDYSQVGPMQYTYSGGPLGESDTIRLLSIGTGINWNTNLRLGFFVRNLLNDRGWLDASGPVTGDAPRAQPRTFGLDFGVNFD